jgi:hypothetical protein
MPNVPGYNAHPGPLTVHAGPPCRYPNCTRPVTRDVETQEFNEYCSLAHIEFVVALQGMVMLWC